MVVNDNAFDLDERGALESIAGRLAPTGSREPVFACERLPDIFHGTAKSL
jgi:hypothetical protein